MRIEICGGVASGKTSLADVLRGEGFHAFYEDFKRNPFFDAFYQDPVAHAFETELTFLLQHYHQVKVNSGPSGWSVFDFSLALDLAYAKVTLPGEDLQVFESLLRPVLGKAGLPNLIVRLRCNSEVELGRIRRRGRAQEQSISLDYLNSLDAALDCVLGLEPFSSIDILEVDSEHLDYVSNGEATGLVQRLVRQRVFETGLFSSSAA